MPGKLEFISSPCHLPRYSSLSWSWIFVCLCFTAMFLGAAACLHPGLLRIYRRPFNELFRDTEVSGNWTHDLTTAVVLFKKTHVICVAVFVFTSGWMFWFGRLMHAIRDVWACERVSVWAPRLQPFWWLTAAAAGSWVCHWHQTQFNNTRVFFPTIPYKPCSKPIRYTHIYTTE